MFFGSEAPREGNLFFAGEHCSRVYQGYMEGACETAEQVAWEILSDLNLPAAAAQWERFAISGCASQGWIYGWLIAIVTVLIWDGELDGGT
jgi:hypothetical protein